MNVVSTPAQLVQATPYEAFLGISADMEMFEKLPLVEKIRLHKLIRGLNTFPEHREDHKWLVSWMKEDIEATEADEAAEAIAKITAARNGVELSQAVSEVVERLTPETPAAEAPEQPEPKIAHVVETVVADNMSERNKVILRLRNEGLSLKQIGEKVGLSGPRVSGIIRTLTAKS